MQVVGTAAPPSELDAPVVLHRRAPRAGVQHPSVHGLGANGPRYVRRRQRRRRVQLVERGGAWLLGAGALVALAALGTADVHADVHADVASAGTTARAVAQSVVAPLTTSHRAAAPITTRGVATSPPKASIAQRPVRSIAVPSTAPPVSSPPVSSAPHTPSFTGAYAPRTGWKQWVAYPANPDDPFLRCTRGYESDTAGRYTAVDGPGTHRGAYQFLRSTWDAVARQAGRSDLIGADPRWVAPADQDWMALYLYRWQGASHWNGRCAGR